VILPATGLAGWFNKGLGLSELGRHDEAIRCYENALESDPPYVAAWSNKGNSLNKAGRFKEAIRCCDKALELEPLKARAWYAKAPAEDILSRWREAALSYQRFLALATAQDAEEITYVRQRLRELGH
jgi:tetratricopeptide (TPR) repeat protein